jgi:hypothetical protein
MDAVVNLVACLQADHPDARELLVKFAALVEPVTPRNGRLIEQFLHE